MSSKVVFILSAAVGAAFIYHGISKLSPNVDEDLHLKMQKKHFVNYARVAPMKLRGIFWWKGSEYRQYVGGLELAGGCGLLTMTGRFTRNISYVLLLLSSLFMCHSYMTLGDAAYKYAIHIGMGTITFAMFLVERRFPVKEDVTFKKGESKDKNVKDKSKKDKPKSKKAD
ncbi:Transmembrane protein 35A [Holothuria leucospilota]|uniref:Novel acetylcholine receptor chaperone n=1 Tax=Holothuria leucospilota TaxID=206669 RepID=A0A9Q1GYX7_HOLLE|nr:Transmembrane protein 35A [Holothuria leucospilota]